MKAYLEIVELKNDVVTVSTEEEECCEWGCDTNFDLLEGNY